MVRLVTHVNHSVSLTGVRLFFINYLFEEVERNKGGWHKHLRMIYLVLCTFQTVITKLNSALITLKLQRRFSLLFNNKLFSLVWDQMFFTTFYLVPGKCFDRIFVIITAESGYKTIYCHSTYGSIQNNVPI